MITATTYKSLLRSCVRSQLAYKEPSEVINLWKKANDMTLLGENETPQVNLIYDELRGIDAEPRFLEAPEYCLCDSQGYLWTRDDTVYLTFRGTSSLLDVISDLNVLVKYVGNGAFVHKGFYKQFQALESTITAALSEFEDKPNLHISGHSLGAGIAQIAAVHYASIYETNKKVICHTFGAPRTGNKRFTQIFESLVSEHVRVCNTNDPVTMIPIGFAWQHTYNKCLQIDDSLQTSSPTADIPWWCRIYKAAPKIDILAPIKDHDTKIYIDRLFKLANQTDSDTHACDM